MGGFHDFSSWWMTPEKTTTAWQNLTNQEIEPSTFKDLLTTFTYALFHSNLQHLLSNTLMIWIFGIVVLQITSTRWLLATFILTAIGGAIGQIALEPDSTIPILGASGAATGLAGFYFGLAILHTRPMAEVWPIARPVHSFELAAVGIVIVLMDLIGLTGHNAGIAYGAHFGGFVTGILISPLADQHALRA